MLKINSGLLAAAAVVALLCTECALPNYGRKTERKDVPKTFNGTTDTLSSAKTKWRDFFSDPNLSALIDTALQNNQELNIVLQEINIARNEARFRKGAYLPFIGVGAAASTEKVGRYTSQGANDANTDIKPGTPFPEPLPDFMFGLGASWELDIWSKLRNSRRAAVNRYFGSIEGKNFLVTNLISEIAGSYYELTALDNQLQILKDNIQIQQNALEIVKLEKVSAKVTELAVRKFEAEVLKNQSRQFYIMQQITEAENRINFLVGRFPQPVARNAKIYNDLEADTVYSGLPSQLLQNRPDIRRAELALKAAKLDVKAAKAEFYPSLRIRAGVGFNSFNVNYLVQSPVSLMYNVAGDLVAPLINRNAIKAQYASATSQQIQAVYNYEKTILNAHIEVVNQLSNISNLHKSYDLKRSQVEALTNSIDISTGLFKAARADYMEVLMTQRDALEAKFELVENRMLQLKARVSVYRALGGGWN